MDSTIDISSRDSAGSGMASPSSAVSVQPVASDRKIEKLDVNVAYSDSLVSVLASLKSTILISTYKTGNLVCVSQRNERIVPAFHTFDRPMGLAVKENGIAVGTRDQIWFLRSSPDIAAKAEPRGQYDAGYLARFAHFTGDIRCHDMGWVNGELWIVNTLFSCLCTIHNSYNFAPRWRPSFISDLQPEDRCHLNGLAVENGQARYVTAMSQTDMKHGWRALKKTDGCLIDITSGEAVVRGLTMPHSPRIAGGKLYLTHSGLGQLELVDVARGRREVVCRLPGYARGLAIIGTLAFVGLSKIRSSSDWEGIPIADDPERLKCGVWVVELRTGNIVATFEFTSGIEELFDVQLLQGVVSPLVSAPLDEHPLWTVPPAR
jgi:uncharacterized protein (TIGR03032 family)